MNIHDIEVFHALNNFTTPGSDTDIIGMIAFNYYTAEKIAFMEWYQTTYEAEPSDEALVGYHQRVMQSGIDELHSKASKTLTAVTIEILNCKKSP